VLRTIDLHVRLGLATDGIFPHAMGGMQRHTVFLANALVREGVDVEVIAPSGHEIGEHTFEVVTADWPSSGSYPLVLQRWSKRVVEAMAGRDYDVVYGQGLTLWGSAPPNGAPTVFNPHGLELCTVPERIARLKAWPLRVGARRQARAAARTISLGGKLTDVIIECLQVPRARVAVIPNGVEPAYFKPDEVKRDPRIVLFVGRLFANKGLDVLCEAALQLPEDVRVLIVGDGPLRAHLEQRYRDPRIVFLGSVDEEELRALYGRAAVLALPTRSDGMPTVILEAFCCGTPAVSTDVGAISELIDETTGVLLPRADAQLLSDALRKILDLPSDQRAAMSHAVRARVETRFAWGAVAQKTKALLEEVIAE
jgi:glycosyltransferase involved in cell wall biosynthesis